LEVVNKRLSSLIENVSVQVEIESQDELKKIIEASLSQMGYKVVLKKSEAATHLLTGELTQEKQHLKVTGFEKYKYSLKLEAARVGASLKKVIKHDLEVTGRDLSQADSAAMVQMKDFLDNNLAYLNIQK
jgi:hypothetical protein